MDTQDALITAALLAIIVYLLYKVSRRNFDHWRKKGIPYIEPIPFLGNLKDVAMFKKSVGHAVGDMYKQIDAPMFGIWCFNAPFLIIKKPELVKRVLHQDFNYFSNRAACADKAVDPISASILFLLKNPEWKAIRTKMTPAFSPSKIRAMMPLLYEAVEDMVHFLGNTCSGILDAREVCAKLSTDIITSCAYGVKGNSFVVDNAPFRDVGKQMFGGSLRNGFRIISYFFMPKIVTLFKIKFVDPSISSLLQSVFWQSVAEREKTNVNRNDLIDFIRKLEKERIDDVSLDKDMMVGQAVMFFIAGFETSSSAMSFTLYELSLNKSIQNALRAEVKSTVAKYGSLTYEAISEMPYIHKVISETLRKYPVLPFLDRRCTKDYHVPDSDIVIEEGTPILIPMYGLHHDPQIYPDPDKYDPERFSEENIKNIPSGAYIPFGVGPRACAGERFGLLSTKLGLAEIILRYEVRRNKNTPETLTFDTTSLTLSPVKGLPLEFVPVKSE